jgi:hypothetical protein
LADRRAWLIGDPTPAAFWTELKELQRIAAAAAIPG